MGNALLATTFDLGPDRLDFLSALLSGAAVGGLLGSALGQRRGGRLDRDQRAELIERYALYVALIAGMLWALGLIVQETQS